MIPTIYFFFISLRQENVTSEYLCNESTIEMAMRSE